MERRLRRLVVPLLALYALAFVPFALVGKPDQLMRLQLAGSASRAREIAAGWSHADSLDLAFLQGFDFVHPLLYGLLLALGATWAGRHLGRGARIAVGAALVAALCDVGENVGMITMIRGDIEAPVPTLTTMFATAKYALLAVALLYTGSGAIARLRGRQRV